MATSVVHAKIHAGAPRGALARIWAERERLLIGSGALMAFLLIWEALGRSGLVDPLFISSPLRVASTGYGLMHDRDFWNDAAVIASEFGLGYAAAAATAVPLGLAIGLSKRLRYLF